MLLSQRDEHLVGAVELLSVLHPHDIRFRETLDGTAEPSRVALRHRLIGRVLGERHAYKTREEERRQSPKNTDRHRRLSSIETTKISLFTTKISLFTTKLVSSSTNESTFHVMKFVKRVFMFSQLR